jgi:hypothetical protein
MTRNLAAAAVVLLCVCTPPQQDADTPKVEVEPSREAAPAPEPFLTAAPKKPPAVAGKTLPVQPCDLDGADTVDLDGDGRPEVFTVKKNGVLYCKAMDLDMDGKPDVRELYDAAGKKTMKLSDLDGDGVFEVRHSYDQRGCTAEYDRDGDGIIDATEPC